MLGFFSCCKPKSPDGQASQCQHFSFSFEQSPVRMSSPSSMIDPSTGRVVNNYVLGRIIYRSDVATVFFAKSMSSNEEFAIKVYDKSLLQRPSAQCSSLIQKLHQEIAIMKKLSHPNIVRLYEVIDDITSPYCYLVLEYVHNGAIMSDECPTMKPINVSTAWKYFRDLVKGVDYLHRHSIIHRDIKPSNILITSSGTAKISDFGVSSYVHHSETEATAGSLPFFAPEIIIGSNGASWATDIYSAGVTLYVMIFGELPFGDVDEFSMFQAICHNDLKLSDDIDPVLADLLYRCLAKDPDQRITMDELKVHPWLTVSGKFPFEDDEGLQVSFVTHRDCDCAITNVSTAIEDETPSLSVFVSPEEKANRHLILECPGVRSRSSTLSESSVGSWLDDAMILRSSLFQSSDYDFDVEITGAGSLSDVLTTTDVVVTETMSSYSSVGDSDYSD
ncbi:hypothetical protein GEMRC1_004264 [Eukaryota sp. GEM-RC1]